jgi:hypothetical protein
VNPSASFHRVPAAAVRAGRVSAAGRPWVGSLAVAAPVWALSYLAYGALTLAMRLGGATRYDGTAPSWRQWDAIWYDLIATHGYLHTGQPAAQAAAFPPLYPALVHAADVVLPGGGTVAAVAISAAAYLAALTVLHRLATREFDAAHARRVLWCLAAFPTAFFLAVGYNLSLSLLLLAGAAYALRGGHWWIAGLVGALATANRTSAVLLVAVFGSEYVRRFGWRVRPVLASVALVPAGLAAYAGYLWMALGDPLAFGHAQRFWSREFDWPWAGFAEAVGLVVAADATFEERFYNLVDLGAVVGLAAMLVVGAARFTSGQRCYALLLAGLIALGVCFPAHTTEIPIPLMSAARLALEAFPAFLVLGGILRGRWAVALAVPAVLLQVVLLCLFVIGKWAG